MKTKQSVVSAGLERNLISSSMVKKLIVPFVLALTSLPLYALSTQDCENKSYNDFGIAFDKYGNAMSPEKFIYCSGTMKLAASGNSGVVIAGQPVNVDFVPSDAGGTNNSNDCSHIHSIFVNKQLKTYLDAHKNDTFTLKACLMPRRFDMGPKTGLFVGDPNFYDPIITNRKLLMNKLRTSTYELRALQRARLEARGINLVTNGAVCELTDIARSKLLFYPGFNETVRNKIDSKKASCDSIIDSLSQPSDILPAGSDICSKNTLMCQAKSTVKRMQKPLNPIIKVVMPSPESDGRMDQARYTSLGASFKFDQFLNAFKDPYFDMLNLTGSNGKSNVEITYEQAGLKGNLRN